MENFHLFVILFHLILTLYKFPISDFKLIRHNVLYKTTALYKFIRHRYEILLISL